MHLFSEYPLRELAENSPEDFRQLLQSWPLDMGSLSALQLRSVNPAYFLSSRRLVFEFSASAVVKLLVESLFLLLLLFTAMWKRSACKKSQGLLRRATKLEEHPSGTEFEELPGFGLPVTCWKNKRTQFLLNTLGDNFLLPYQAPSLPLYAHLVLYVFLCLKLRPYSLTLINPANFAT